MKYIVPVTKKILVETENGTQGKKLIFVEKYGSLLKMASRSTSSAHNCKWEEEFHKTIIQRSQGC